MSEIRVESDGPKFAMTPEWIIDAPISDRAVRLWAILHRHAHGKDQCDPTRTSLAERLRCSVDSVDRAVRELCAVAAMTVVRRPTGEGKRHLPSVYRLHFDGRGVAAVDGGGGRTHAATNGRSHAATGSRTGAAQKTESSTTEREEISSPSPTPQSARFDEFWQTYPKRVGKGRAQRIWDRVCRKVEPEIVIAGARRYAEERAGQDPEFTAHPSSWLNAERWTDEPSPAKRNGHTVAASAKFGTGEPSGGSVPKSEFDAVMRARTR